MPKIDPKVCDWICPYSKVVDGTVCKPINQKLLEEFIDENEIVVVDRKFLSRDPFLVTQYLERHSVSSDRHMKKSMSLREGLHVIMQLYMRQHFADLYWLHEHPGGHASWERTNDEEIHQKNQLLTS